MDNQLLFAVNQAAKGEYRQHNGRMYLVAPTISLREGVLNNELVLADEFGKHVLAWNGRPFVIGHPKDAEGKHISANSPEILDDAIGYVFGTTFDGKLNHQVWIDVSKAGMTADGREIIRRVEKGEPLDISSAYWRDLDKTPGSRDGKEYVGIARNLRPDHVAALLYENGACSWKDGCGVPRVNSGEEETMQVNVMGTARRPSYEGTEETPWANVTKTFEAFRDGYYRNTGTDRPEDAPNRVQDAPAAMKRWIASKTLLGDPRAEMENELIFFPVVNPGTNRLNAGAVRAVLGGRGAAANIPEAAKTSAQNMARSLLDSEFKTNEMTDWLKGAFTKVADALGVNLQSNNENEGGSKVNETIARIVEAAGLKDGSQFAELPEETLTALADALEKHEEQEREDSAPEPQVNEEKSPCEQQAQEAQELPVEIVTLAKAINERGGLDNVLGLIDGLQANEDGKKAELVERLAANSACAFSKDDMAGMSLDALMKLHKSLTPADYSGRGAELLQANEGLTEIPMPKWFENQEVQ